MPVTLTQSLEIALLPADHNVANQQQFDHRHIGYVWLKVRFFYTPVSKLNH